MKSIKNSEWIPADRVTLEDNALDVVTKEGNYLVVAGPGAGKTELLAQKACFLLQTNTCKFPHKILAISFKRDAAYNLKERVRLRCGPELSRRFDSLTFDSFAKHLLDRFRQGLSPKYKVVADYEVVLSDQYILDSYKAEDIGYVSTTDREVILNFHTSELPFGTSTKEEKIRNEVWKKLLEGKDCKLSFKMIMRLAEYIISCNAKVKKYLQQTYHYIFLDEFQDTTEVQYEFFKNCFLGSNSFFTAVGDDKQRIMLWAGALDPIFDNFIADTHAKRTPLTMNFRCAPRLVSLLNHLTEHLLGKKDFAIPSPKWKPDQGECFVWLFESPSAEMQILFNAVQDWMARDNLNPRDICILVKQQLGRYAGHIIEYFNQNGIKARDENKLQDLLTQEISVFIINVLYIVFQNRAGGAKQIAFAFLSNLHTEIEDEQLLRLENSFSKFIRKLKTDYGGKTITEHKIKSMIEEIVNYAGKDRIRAHIPSLRNILMLNKIIAELQDEFINSYHDVNDIIKALDKLIGKDTVPVMTIHKSKGLEYHTVIFVGLEDGAFWSFDKQPDEDKCAFFVALSRAKERVAFTFSKVREDRFDRLRPQSFDKIEIIFRELENSGIVQIEDKK
ncbi:ATP-dependent helicase [Flavobacterium sp.]|uniref:UvrD-helicase domain-containing protein n=1 Tax=Flavobacterium sp. TaxID=239 RepID=UPI0026263442|nr:ATP-dependent helicase [Flavobacterium sp.]